MKDWTIGKRITFGFGIVILLTIGLAAFSVTRLYIIQNNLKVVTEKAIPRAKIIDNVRFRVTDVLLLTYKLIASTNQQDVIQLQDSIKSNVEANTKDFNTYKQMSSMEPNKLALYDQIGAVRSKYGVVMEKVVSDGTKTMTSEDIARVYNYSRSEFDPLVKEMVNLLSQMSQDEGKDVAKNGQVTDETIQNCVRVIVISSLGVLALVVVLSFFIITRVNAALRQISTLLNDSSLQVSTAAKQVASSSQSLAEGASEQAASLEETSSSLEEMSSMTRQNADNSKKTNDLAVETSKAASRAVENMHSMSSAMSEIKTSSDEVAKIIKTIDEIAFQTNILALNAAVEAARAGEAGMGFAVVADEVRNLAQRSAVAAKETAEKIEGAITHTAQGVELSAKVASALNEIMETARKMEQLAGEVAAASTEQSQGVDQVNVAVSQMDKVTQSNAGNAEESAAASEELSAQAESLQDAIKQLLQLVGSSKQDTLAHHAGAKNKPVPSAKVTVESDDAPKLQAPNKTAKKNSKNQNDGDFF